MALSLEPLVELWEIKLWVSVVSYKIYGDLISSSAVYFHKLVKGNLIKMTVKM